MAEHVPFEVALKLGKGGSSSGGSSMPMHDGEGSEDAPLRAAAKDLIAAVKDGDVEAVMDALHAAVLHCTMPPDEDMGEKTPEE